MFLIQDTTYRIMRPCAILNCSQLHSVVTYVTQSAASVTIHLGSSQLLAPTVCVNELSLWNHELESTLSSIGWFLLWLHCSKK